MHHMTLRSTSGSVEVKSYSDVHRLVTKPSICFLVTVSNEKKIHLTREQATHVVTFLNQLLEQTEREIEIESKKDIQLY